MCCFLCAVTCNVLERGFTTVFSLPMTNKATDLFSTFDLNFSKNGEEKNLHICCSVLTVEIFSAWIFNHSNFDRLCFTHSNLLHLAILVALIDRSPIHLWPILGRTVCWPWRRRLISLHFIPQSEKKIVSGIMINCFRPNWSFALPRWQGSTANNEKRWPILMLQHQLLSKPLSMLATPR